MQRVDLSIRAATLQDAADIAPLINRAGEGLPMALWSQMAEPGQSAMEFGVARIRNPESGISYVNCWIAEIDDKVAGCMITYLQPTIPEPVPDDCDPRIRPLLELELLAPDTGYVYVLSTLAEFRGQGVGSRLLGFAESLPGQIGMSLIVSDANFGARRLYERCGYRSQDSRPMVKGDWQSAGKNWILMVKQPEPGRQINP